MSVNQSARHYISIVSFSDQANLLLPLTTNYQQAKGTVLSLGIAGWTNLGAGLTAALQELRKIPEQSQKYIILLSDGHLNRGLSENEILRGPVAEARRRRICIHTVGFGGPGHLKEEFLRRIAQESGCGEYLYAATSFDLTNAYIKLRHLSLGGLIAEFVSQGAKIYQGETLTLGAVSIPSLKENQGKEIEELHFTLSWSGSHLKARLFDPSDREITLSYPGADIKYFERFAHVVVLKPKPGLWRVVVFGEDVPPGGSDFYAVLSTRPGEAGKLARSIPLINPTFCIEHPWGKECHYLFQGNIPTWMIIVITFTVLAVTIYLKLSGEV